MSMCSRCCAALNAQLLENPGAVAAARSATKPLERYIARALADGSATAAPLFDEMVTLTEMWLARADETRPDTPTVDRRIRAAVVTAMAAGMPLLHEHVSRALGADMFGPDGERLLGPRPARHLLSPAAQHRNRRRGPSRPGRAVTVWREGRAVPR